MCGIAGFFSPNNDGHTERLAAIGRTMGDAIAHRGPDGHGVWVDTRRGVVLSHQRLAVVDLSPHGSQPMVSASGRYVITFNGEIYNFQQLRSRLEREGSAPAWRGHSDTEVLLAAFEAWGFEASLQQVNGMFALAVVDTAQDQLLLARDRMGEKPLYYGWQGQSFLFASQLKALHAHPDFQRRIEPHALSLYFRFAYVPAPWSIYHGIHKLPPGHLLRFPLGTRHILPVPGSYWRLPTVGAADEVAEPEAVDALDALLREAVNIRLHSDVPVGAFLSGGIDSSAIVALMQAQARRPVRTYSIGFRERSHDESAHARAVAQALGTVHTDLYVTPAQALEVVADLPQIYDEPFGDSSQIPTYLLSKLTREHVTVALSGDGGDEVFGGYMRYLQGTALQRSYDRVPAWMRVLGAGALRFLARPAWDQFLRCAPRPIAVQLSSERMHKLARVVPLQNYREMYKNLVSHWDDPADILPSVVEPRTLLDDEGVARLTCDPVSWMMQIDQLTYLPDDVLVKVDRASMAVALETRVPFLDPNIVQFAARLPKEMKLRGGVGKWLLRQVLSRYLDPGLVHRPKQGFAVPVGEWLRGPLRAWSEELLSPDALNRSGLLEAGPIRRAWQEHLGGRRTLNAQIWVILMFQAWYYHTAPRLD